MTNLEAAKRIAEKVRYTESKIAESPADRANFWREQDCTAFSLAIAALKYLHELQEYEASQVPRE